MNKMKMTTQSNLTSLSLKVFQVLNLIHINVHNILPFISKSKQISVRLLDKEIIQIANNTNKPNQLEILDYRDEYHGLVDCLNGKPSKYQNLYESLIKRGFKIAHWQPTTQEDFCNEKHPYIMITWM